jgi:hypothetical protein
MAEPTAFRQVIEVLVDLGIYDVILPFLLVFTIVFAILEKTKILGVEKIEGTELPKKNLNAMFAFVVSFLVIASTQLVAVVSQVMAHVVLLLILAVCFLMLVGVFFGDKEFTLKDYPGWVKFFMVLMFIGIVVIFLNALDWLKFIFGIFDYLEIEWLVGILFFLLILVFMWYIVHDPQPKKSKKKED